MSTILHYIARRITVFGEIRDRYRALGLNADADTMEKMIRSLKSLEEQLLSR